MAMELPDEKVTLSTISKQLVDIIKGFFGQLGSSMQVSI